MRFKRYSVLMAMLLGISTFSMFPSSIPSVKAGAVTLRVDPTSKTFYAPAFGEVFTINVTIQHVVDLYGFEFKLYYDTRLLDAVQVIEGPFLRSFGDTFCARNASNDAAGLVWVAVTLKHPAPSASGNGTLTSITFKITYDPIWPENVTSALHLDDTWLSDRELKPIFHERSDGEYQCYSTLPKLEVQPPSCKAIALGETFDINVTISGVAKLYGYGFTLSYNTTILDAVEITVRPFLYWPTWLYTKQILDDEGIVRVRIRSYGLAPSANGSGVLTTITFRSTSASPCVSTWLDLHHTRLTTRDGTEIKHEVVDGYYESDPLEGDVNGDGKVNVVDLSAVARAYGSEPGDPEWIPSADIKGDGIINIYDLVAVAANLGNE